MIYSKKILIFAILLICFWGLVGFTLLFVYSPFNPTILPERYRAFSIKFTPQGWGFFTRNPREQSLSVYQKVGANWVKKTVPNIYFKMGAGRDMRMQGAELGSLLQMVSTQRWKNYRQGEFAIQADSLPSLTLVNKYMHPSLCGEIVVKSQEPLPWAWSKDGKDNFMPYRLLKLNIDCNAPATATAKSMD